MSRTLIYHAPQTESTHPTILFAKDFQTLVSLVREPIHEICESLQPRMAPLSAVRFHLYRSSALPAIDIADLARLCTLSHSFSIFIDIY